MLCAGSADASCKDKHDVQFKVSKKFNIKLTP